MNLGSVQMLNQTLDLGDHISCIYRTETELFSIIIPFLIDGLKKHNKCVYALGDNETSDSIKAKFIEAGFDLSLALSNQDFIFVTYQDTYLKNETFNGKDMISLLVSLQSDAIKQGYTALRVTGNASWLTTHRSDVVEFLKYEAEINGLIEDSEIIALCQYNESLFEPRILIDVLRTHPLVYLYGRFVTNTYFSVLGSSIPQINVQEPELFYEKMINSLSS